MRRWLVSAAAALRLVADRPALWLPGALAWAVTVGWAALLLGVARPPTTADLTFVGAGIFTSGAWPWNAVALSGAALLLPVAALSLAAVAETSLLEQLHGRHARPAAIPDTVVVGGVVLLPVLLVVVAAAIGVVLVAPAEFTAPENGVGPVARTAARLAPLLVVLVLVASLAGAVHAAAVRRILVAGSGVGSALVGSTAWLRRAGWAAMVHLLAVLVARVVTLVAAAFLLRMLWTPISDRLTTGGIDPVAGLLLVGFVAIWLCIVLGGGALHAWGSATWSALLADEASHRPTETPTHL